MSLEEVLLRGGIQILLLMGSKLNFGVVFHTFQILRIGWKEDATTVFGGGVESILKLPS